MTLIKKRLYASTTLFLVGGFILWMNWDDAHFKGQINLKLALINPTCFVFSFYFLLFRDDPLVMPKPIPFRLLGAYVISFVLAGVNIFLLKKGIY